MDNTDPYELKEFKPNPNAERLKKDLQDRDIATRIAVLRAEWGLPLRFSSFNPPREGPWGQKLQELILRLGTGCLVALVGGRGNGKTQMSAELMKITTERLKSALYVTASRFFMKIKATYGDGAIMTEEQVVDSYRKPSLLVIDEIGKQPEKEWHSNLLFEVINCRYGDMTDTILIDNRTVPMATHSLGDSIISRMQETGGIVDCNWPSFRKGKV